jgi:hypothetical protein
MLTLLAVYLLRTPTWAAESHYAFFAAESVASGSVEIDYLEWASDPQDVEYTVAGVKTYRFLKPIDWSTKAHKYSKFNIDHPSANDLDMIKKSYCEDSHCSKISYQAAIDSDVPKGYYYLISPSGIHELAPTQLLGTIRYDWNKDFTAIDRIDYFGAIVADAKSPMDAAEYGVVLFSLNPLTIEKDLVHASLPNELGPYVQTFTMTIKSEQISYLFIDHGPDTECKEGCCQFRYSLFPLINGAPSNEPVAAINAQCDE